jgi:predicted HTH transcriptional regulator
MPIPPDIENPYIPEFEEYTRQKAIGGFSCTYDIKLGTQSAIQSANAALSKSNNCTLEETAVLQIIRANPRATQKQIAEVIGKSERTIKTITVNLTQKGLLVRRNGKRDGYWEIEEK